MESLPISESFLKKNAVIGCASAGAGGAVSSRFFFIPLNMHMAVRDREGPTISILLANPNVKATFLYFFFYALANGIWAQDFQSAWVYLQTSTSH